MAITSHRLQLVLLLALAVISSARAADFVVRELAIDGLKRTREWVVTREVSFAVGDSIAADELLRLRNRLNNLIIFNDVTVTADSCGRVVVAVTEAWPYIPIAAVAFTEGRVADVNSVEGFFDRAAVLLGGMDLNFRGDAGRIWLMTEFGATNGVAGGYVSRWLAPRLPLAAELAFQSLSVSDRHSALLDSSRSLRDNRVGVSLSTRQGARSRVGAEFLFRHVKQEDAWPAEGRTDQTAWCSPFAAIDRRDLEWYPARGAYARAQTNVVTGTVSFLRSTVDLRGFWSVPDWWMVSDDHRPPVLALRATGGTATAATPSWSHFYSGFNRGFRGYRTAKAEAANYLSAEAEFRFPLIRERTFTLRRFGSYGSRLPVGLSAFVAGERFELQLDGARADGYACAAGLLIRVPYIQIVEAAWEINRERAAALSLEAGVRF